ncbi:hypothetical protein [Parafrankia elaeagni]|uniref:hypothetical protein n=1 Tax=Parafrankia elaeagni TaxID=222534 RepID=UPI00036DFA80|nr:hypothetical protein [Parafrankia elaeagni]
MIRRPAEARFRRGLRRRAEQDRGSFAVEFAAGFGIVIAALLLMAIAYQTSQSGAVVTSAAREAARAASLTATTNDARHAAEHLVRTRFADTGTCAQVTVKTTTSRFRAAGTVLVTVTCRTNGLMGWQRTLRATGEATIDRYRGGLP